MMKKATHAQREHTCGSSEEKRGEAKRSNAKRREEHTEEEKETFEKVGRAFDRQWPSRYAFIAYRIGSARSVQKHGS